ncbi:hypothetical protein P3X46_008791 [Hevea brasiliensis]|uniref:Uncharacterized protein n=1 Tax=Hevea brasiliensis TaxID=3981 RepID=A0ABQ9MME3_HEVBR|nr:hypothetical protein P3X46_008791 [Hevea brasiliensis]
MVEVNSKPNNRTYQMVVQEDPQCLGTVFQVLGLAP